MTEPSAPRAVVIGTPEQEQRRRTVKQAHELLDTALGGQWKGRKQAREAVALHRMPMTRARQIVDYERRKRMFGEPTVQVAAPAQPKVRRSKARRAQMAAAGMDLTTVDRPVVAYVWPKNHRDRLGPLADISDIDELIVKLTNRGVRDPLFGSMVRRLAQEVAKGLMRSDYERRAAEILMLDPTWPADPASPEEHRWLLENEAGPPDPEDADDPVVEMAA